MSAYFLKSLHGLLKEHIQRCCRCFDSSTDERKEWTLTNCLSNVWIRCFWSLRVPSCSLVAIPSWFKIIPVKCQWNRHVSEDEVRPLSQQVHQRHSAQEASEDLLTITKCAWSLFRTCGSKMTAVLKKSSEPQRFQLWANVPAVFLKHLFAPRLQRGTLRSEQRSRGDRCCCPHTAGHERQPCLARMTCHCQAGAAERRSCRFFASDVFASDSVLTVLCRC